jgi:hypothetical protein
VVNRTKNCQKDDVIPIYFLFTSINFPAKIPFAGSSFVCNILMSMHWPFPVNVAPVGLRSYGLKTGLGEVRDTAWEPQPIEFRWTAGKWHSTSAMMEVMRGNVFPRFGDSFVIPIRRTWAPCYPIR